MARSVDMVNPVEHLYYVSSQQEEQEAIIKKYEDQDFAVFNLMSLLNKNRIKDLAWILGAIGNGEYTGGMDSSAIIKVAKTYVHTKAEGPKRFNAAFNLYQSEKDRVICMALVNRGIALGIVRNHSGEYVVPEFEGKTFDTKSQMVEYLLRNEGKGSLRELLAEKVGL
ncbi:MAG: hypothetical protein D6683_15630 [Actinomyces sp.]|nr:MAG: hypothetical protein D6683_15630 [Actinomyces sp.]